ncbi:MAG TPA: N-acetylmuramoyl-L-alanine amidase [Anaerolineales bacterium]|nr:N-acetylmuramoyl-L-alanine amidase [Anaerolineales bacterium]
MKISENHRLLLDLDEEFDFRFDPSPNVLQSRQSAQRYLIIHATEGASVNGAVSTFKARNGLSVHLILGKDGKELVQMLSFDKGGKHASEYNNKSIGIELDYPGDLRDSGSKYQLRSEFAPHQYIQATAFNDSRLKYWPLYPKAQLDALLNISKILIDKYQITNVVGHEELYSYKLDPGPAFPIIQFREKLLGVTDQSIELQETTRRVRVRNGPGEEAVFLSETRIPAGKPVSIINQVDDWCLISVIGEVEGNPWIVGWVEKSAVRVKKHRALMVRTDHYLATPEGRRVQVIAPNRKNYDDKHPIIGPKYIVIHFTTGTRLESTIAHFRNELSGVCTHLLVGRDGRIIQFLPFNKIAFHAGYSWWEGDSSLNRFSIGIELDNAGFLKKTADGWVRKSTPIPKRRVKSAVHWRESKERDWEKFTRTQLQVTLEIVHALKERYGTIVEILGHDEVNLRERLDPGPLFPMERFRKKLFGRTKPLVEEFVINRSSDLYTNVEGHLPNVVQRLHASFLPSKSIVEVTKQAGPWSLVKVIRSSQATVRHTIGWILSSSLAVADNKGTKGGGKKNRATRNFVERKITKRQQVYYKRGASPPTPKLSGGPFPPGTSVRIQEVRGEWTLVALLEPFKGRKGLEGWIRSEALSRKE